MGLLDESIEAIIGIFIAVVFFFTILPTMAKEFGTVDPNLMYLLGFLIVIAIIASLIKRV